MIIAILNSCRILSLVSIILLEVGGGDCKKYFIIYCVAITDNYFHLLICCAICGSKLYSNSNRFLPLNGGVKYITVL